MSGIRIDARAVGYSAGGRKLISRVSFRVLPGEVLALLGPSGAGKSTVLRCLDGSRSPDAGKVFYDGVDFWEDRDRFRGRIGSVPQDDIVHLALTPERSLHYALRLRKPEMGLDKVDERVSQVLEELELAARRNVITGKLSGGQRKRVSIGVELVASPGVLFLDEPTSGLDPALERKAMELVANLARQNHTVLLTTHTMDSLDLVHQVAFLKDGRLAYFGPPSQACAYFGVDSFNGIFDVLKQHEAAEWADRFDRSPLAGPAREREAASAAPPAPPVKLHAPAPAPTAKPASEEDLIDQLRDELRREGRLP